MFRRRNAVEEAFFGTNGRRSMLQHNISKLSTCLCCHPYLLEISPKTTAPCIFGGAGRFSKT